MTCRALSKVAVSDPERKAGTDFDRVTGKPKVIGSSVGSVPINALVFTIQFHTPDKF